MVGVIEPLHRPAQRLSVLALSSRFDGLSRW